MQSLRGRRFGSTRRLFFLFALAFYRENPWMTAAQCANFIIGVLVHTALRWSMWRSAAESDASSETAAA
jgi:hypothetical protein